jgi:5-(carboxyamino)imidazole ribonucleotide mutase
MAAPGEIAVSVVVGSANDVQFIKNAVDVLKDFKVNYELQVLSAHRTLKKVTEFAEQARTNGIKVIIAAAGGAAHLAGVIAASTTLPVIGVPVPTKHLEGMDSLLSTVQMPTGVPVATVGIGEAGAKNAALLAIQILALTDRTLSEKLKTFRQVLEEKVLRDNKELNQ